MRTGRAGLEGFAYVGLLALVAVLLLALGVASEEVATQAKREREADLIFIGRQFRKAIATYYEESPPDNMRFPRSVRELLSDERFPKPARHLRKLYADPMTGNSEWGHVRNEQGELIGVYSLSQEKPLRTVFDEDLRRSFGTQHIASYADWKFIYIPKEGPSGNGQSGQGVTLELTLRGNEPGG